jgi:hypothetical protein
MVVMALNPMRSRTARSRQRNQEKGSDGGVHGAKVRAFAKLASLDGNLLFFQQRNRVFVNAI